jgi:phosphatidylinositol-3,4,5-trisphosphate 3-phosphatase/dual-specificity protein phosphatase PTEN
MAFFLRGKVSKTNKRYQGEGFDLDLTYITPRIISMGFPSENVEGLFRNHISEVRRFLNHFHHGHYKVFNLASEQRYQSDYFFRTSEYPFADHTVPPFEYIIAFCKDAEEWLNADPENVIAVHCKAGKGRTGLMVSSLLMHIGVVGHDAEVALDYFGKSRTTTGKAVHIPSQRRFVGYYASLLQGAPFPLGRKIQFHKLRMFTVPNFDIGGGCDPYFKLSMNSTVVFKTKPLQVARDAEIVEVDFGAISVTGLIRLDIDDADVTTDDHIGHIWLHSDFIAKDATVLTFTQADIDGAHELAANYFKPNFKIELHVSAV